MEKEKRYRGIKIQIVGIAILVVGLFFINIQQGLRGDRPFMVAGIIVTIVGIMIISYGALRKD